MSVVLALMGFAVIAALLVGVFIFLFGNEGPASPSEEWPVLAEAENSHEIYALKGVLEGEDVPVLVETESSEAGGLPTTLTRNRLRVPPDRQQEALELIRGSDLNSKHFRMRDWSRNEG